MESVHFTDGFDGPDRVLLGLGAWQVLAAAASVVTSIVIVRSPLPRPLALAAVLLSLAAGAVLGCMRFAGRPALEWAAFALRFAAGSRQGVRLLESAATPVTSPAAVRGSQSPVDPRPMDNGRIIPLRLAFAAGPALRVAMEPPPVRPRPDGARRVVVFSLQRGSGRTTVATELSIALATVPARRVRVALVDLDTRRSAVAVRLGLRPSNALHTFLLGDPDRRRVVDHMVRHDSGASVLCGPDRAGVDGCAPSDAAGREILRELDLERFDAVVVDLAPELTPLTSAVLRSADDVLLVCTPTPDGVHDAYRATEALRRLGLRHRLRYVINRTRPGVAMGEMIDDLKADVVAQVPDDPCVTAAAAQHIAVASLPGSDAAAALRQLADHVLSAVHGRCSR